MMRTIGRFAAQMLIIVGVTITASSQSITRQLAAYATSDDMFQLTSSATSATRTVVVDRTTLLSLTITAASRTLTVTLTSPGGARFTIGEQNSAAGFHSQIVNLMDGATAGASYIATLANPATGNWSITVAERSQLIVPLDVAVMTAFNNATRLVLLSGDDSFPAGTAVRMAAAAFDSTAKITSLTVTALVRSTTDPSLAPLTVIFRDDGTSGDEKAGDGIYEAFVTTTSTSTFRPGRYVVHAIATGTASTGSFRRTAATQFRIVQTDAQISGFFDIGVDDDFDFYYDRVVITTEATVASAGAYRIAVRLRASNGREIQHSVDVQLSSVSANAEVSFTAAEITRGLGVPGPYSVAEVRYSHLSSGDVVPADVRYNLGSTASYTFDELQHPTIRLTGSGNAFGIDQDHNGLFDVLEIDLGIAVDFPGSYDASVSLVDRNNHEVGFANGTIQLGSGFNTLKVTFDGRRIGTNGVDGPYTLVNLIAFGENQSLIATTAFVTPAFHASAFEGYIVSRTRPARHH